jgi:hypothetical protein
LLQKNETMHKFKQILLWLLALFFEQQHILAQDKGSEVVIAKVLASDKTQLVNYNTRYGPQFYYGVQHYKVALLDTRQKITDTVVIVIVYNMITERASYKKNFGIKVGNKYIFHLTEFTPSKSDFIRLNGKIKNDQGLFEPSFTRLIDAYYKINRIIFFVPYLE